MNADEIHTVRGTHVQMIQHPLYGMTCYMDGCIQSSEADEKVYHEGLVGFALLSVPHAKRVLILGGGEGATAREVLRSRVVEQVEMVDWDKDVIDLFRTRYPQWGQNAWTDPRLHVQIEDAFSYVPTLSAAAAYDVIVVDLFDPERSDLIRWLELLCALERLLSPTGALVMYTGMYQPEMTQQLYDLLSASDTLFPNHTRIPYRVWIPSFEGESTFLLFRPRDGL